MSTELAKRDPRALLSLLWVFFLLNVIFRDIHQFLSPGYMDMVIAGEILGQQFTDELLLYGGFAVEIMLIMVIAPVVLPRLALRIVNPIAALFATGLILFTPPIDPADVFFLVIGIVTLVAIVWIGWTRFAPQDDNYGMFGILLGIVVVLAAVWIGWRGCGPMDLKPRGQAI